MSTKKPELPPTHDENEVLRRMLHTPPTPHKEKPAPAKKKPAAKRPAPRKPWE
jgi:hypothetical protein